MSTTLTSLGLGSSPRYFEPRVLSENYAAGIELEIEGISSTALRENLSSDFWNLTTDGSLRNGFEIVAKRGHSGVKLEKAVANLSSALALTPPTLSERCSTHIHLDVSDMTAQQLINLLCLSIVFEHCMFNLFGSGRGSNNFCLTTDSGTQNYDSLVDIISSGASLRSIAGNYDWAKYAAIGLYRLRDLGTVEYRMFEPLITQEEYFRALEFLFALKREAMNMRCPQDIIDFKKINSLEATFRRLFESEVYNEELEQDLERGVRTLNDILTAVRVLEEVQRERQKYEALIEQAREQIFTIERGI